MPRISTYNKRSARRNRIDQIRAGMMRTQAAIIRNDCGATDSIHSLYLQHHPVIPDFRRMSGAALLRERNTPPGGPMYYMNEKRLIRHCMLIVLWRIEEGFGISGKCIFPPDMPKRGRWLVKKRIARMLKDKTDWISAKQAERCDRILAGRD